MNINLLSYTVYQYEKFQKFKKAMNISFDGYLRMGWIQTMVVRHSWA